MAKTAVINVRTEPDVKINAEKVFSNFGITLSDAINIFLRKSIMDGGIPFDVRQPRYNAETEAAINEARNIMSGKIKAKRYNNVDEAFKDLGINA